MIFGQKRRKAGRHFTRMAPAPRQPTWPATARSVHEDKHFDAPHSREAEAPLAEGEKHDQLAEEARMLGKPPGGPAGRRAWKSFPGSDPVSVKRIT